MEQGSFGGRGFQLLSFRPSDGEAGRRAGMTEGRALLMRRRGAAEAGAARQGKSAQELLGRHGALAGALDLDEADGALAAGDGEPVVEDLAGLAAAIAEGRAQD